MKDMIHCSFKKAAFLLLACISIWGCVRDPDQNLTPASIPSKTEVTFTVTVPGQQIPSTRSIADGAGESKVEFIDLLIFDKDGKFSLHVPVTDLTQVDAATVTFDVTLTIEDDDQTVVVLANVPAEKIATAVAGETPPSKHDVLSKLTNTWDGKWKTDPDDYTPIPMYGEVSIGDIATETVTLTRMLARVDVVNSASNFTITEICVVNYNTTGNIAPAWNPSTGAIYEDGDLAYPYNNNLNPTAPAIGWGKQEYLLTGKKLAHESLNIGKDDSYKGEIYLYEAVKNENPIPDAQGNMTEDANHTNAICLIVKGYWTDPAGENSGIYYYRIDFTAAQGASQEPEDVEYMPVYRNHLYTFEIVAVNGIGYADETPGDGLGFDAALKSFGMMNNLKTNLHVINQAEVTDMVFNGQHYIGLGNAVTFGYLKSVTPVSVPCVTNYWGGWSLDVSKGTGGITYEPNSDDDWLSATPSGDKKEIILETKSDNAGGDNRIAYVHVKAGRLTHQLKVTQRYNPFFFVNPKTFTFGYKADPPQPAILESNITWSVASKPAWCTVTPSSGKGNANLSIDVGALGLNTLSESGYIRSGNIDFLTPEDISLGASQSLTVNQYAPVLLNTTDESILHNNSTIFIPYQEKSYTISVTTNLPGWLLKVYTGTSGTDPSAIINIGDRNGTTPVIDDIPVTDNTIEITIPLNRTLSNRTFRLVLSSEEFPDSEDDQVVATITQRHGHFPAYPGVIAYDPIKGDLNLQGRGVMAYFKFGGIIGMCSGIEEDKKKWLPEFIVFNTTDISDFTNYFSFPKDWEQAGEGKNFATVGLQDITSEFHNTMSNILKGNGDPCRFIKANGSGMTVAEIKAALANGNGTVPNQNIWRLPSEDENTKVNIIQESWVYKAPLVDDDPRPGHTFSGLNKGANWADESWNFLPAAGRRKWTGTPSWDLMDNGFYFANTGFYRTQFNANEYCGWYLNFGETFLDTKYTNNALQSNGYPIRCVRQ